MSGLIIHDTPIAVDFWKIKECSSVRLFFLTHAHADHIQGLTPSWYLPIYCSPLTKKLLLHLVEFTAKDIIHELAVDESHVIEVDGNETITVTVIDANHCPGAVMFLFEGRFGRILYTGDFRYSGPLLNDATFLTNCTNNIDVLYIDNTFLHPRCKFPTREEATVKVLNTIKSNDGARVVIGLRRLGKEDLLIQIARLNGMTIGVDEARYKFLEIIEVLDVFSISPSCLIQVIDMKDITQKNMEKWNSQSKTIAIIPTGLEVALGKGTFCHHPDVHVIPYSDHCSFDELMDFVQMVEPGKIYPILGAGMKDRLSTALDNRSDMSCFAKFLKSSSVDNSSRISSAVGHTADITSSRRSVFHQSSLVSPGRSVSKSVKPATKKKFKFKSRTEPKGVEYTSESPAKHSRLASIATDTSSSTRQEQGRFEDCLRFSASSKPRVGIWNPFPFSDSYHYLETDKIQLLIMETLEPLLHAEAARLVNEARSSEAKVEQDISGGT